MADDKPSRLPRVRADGRTWLRVRALLAGGLVLGVGATVTLASWNDSEYASGSFTTSTFDLQSSLTNVPATFSSHPVGAPLVMEFAATNMAPGSSRHEQIFIRNTGNIAGTYSFSAPAMITDDPSYPLESYLTYRSIESTAPCAASSFTAGATYLAGGPTALVPIGTAPAVSRNISAGGTVLGICTQVQLATTTPNDRQGRTAVVRFVTTATSVTP